MEKWNTIEFPPVSVGYCSYEGGQAGGVLLHPPQWPYRMRQEQMKQGLLQESLRGTQTTLGSYSMLLIVMTNTSSSFFLLCIGLKGQKGSVLPHMLQELNAYSI